MSELRWNPLLGTWTIVAANRQNRPNMPKDWCPFCPGPGKSVPNDYSVYLYPNDFPALSGLDLPEIDHPKADILYASTRAKGACEVVLYSSDHHARICDLNPEHMDELMALWVSRMQHYRQFKTVNYIFIFENKGQEVGVTMPHPHGQIYAYPFVPLKIETELRQCKDYHTRTGHNLFDDMCRQESMQQQRIIFETAHFLVFLPHFTDYPYGVFIVAKNKGLFLDEMSAEQQSELGAILQDLSGMFDALFDKPFPYMMCMHQGVLHADEWAGQEDFYRFHIEFYPPLRTATAVKYYASSEMGAWAAANTRLVEETAEELREALKIWQKQKK